MSDKHNSLVFAILFLDVFQRLFSPSSEWRVINRESIPFIAYKNHIFCFQHSLVDIDDIIISLAELSEPFSALMISRDDKKRDLELIERLENAFDVLFKHGEVSCADDIIRVFALYKFLQNLERFCAAVHVSKTEEFHIIIERRCLFKCYHACFFVSSLRSRDL